MANNDSVLPLYVPDTDELEEVVFIINVTMILKKNRYQSWLHGRTVQWPTTWYLLAWPSKFELSGQIMNTLVRILEYTLEIQPQTEVGAQSMPNLWPIHGQSMANLWPIHSQSMPIPIHAQSVQKPISILHQAPIKSFQYYESLGFPAPLESEHLMKVPGCSISKQAQFSFENSLEILCFWCRLTGVATASKYSARLKHFQIIHTLQC